MSNLTFKTGDGWKACHDEETDRYFGEFGGGMNYELYELTKEIYEQLSEDMSEGKASSFMCEGRRLYMAVNDRCGPPYTIIFDDDYEELCPWANVVHSGKEWPDELTDAAVEIFASEEDNRTKRRKKREEETEKKE